MLAHMIVVTGANGFIGSCMVKELLQRKHNDIIATDAVGLNERPGLLERTQIREFLPPAELFDFLKSTKKIEAIFHMGACSSTTETNEEYLKSNNTEYTTSLFAHAAANKIPFIYASSAAVYGDGELGFDDQKPSDIYKPMNLYGWSKLKADIEIEATNNHSFRWAGLRFFNVYGPNEYHKGEMSSVVYKAFLQIQNTNKLKLFKSYNSQFKDGMQMRDFVYVKDVTRWMYDIWKSKNFVSGIYNMGAGKARTWYDLGSAVFANLDKKVDIEWIEMPEHIRDHYQYFTEAKMDKLDEQGLAPSQYPLEIGIADYVNHHLKKL